MKKKKQLRLGTVADHVITYFLLLIVAFVFFFPCLWLILASLSKSGSLYEIHGFFPAESGILFRVRFNLRV